MKQFTLLLDDDLWDAAEEWGHTHDRSFSESLRHGLRMFFLPTTSPEKAPRGRIPFEPPSVEEIAQYIIEKGYSFAAEDFYRYYDRKKWRIGNQPMRDWRRACVTWQKNEVKPSHPPMFTGIPSPPPGREDYREKLRKEMEEFENGLPPGERRVTKP